MAKFELCNHKKILKNKDFSEITEIISSDFFSEKNDLHENAQYITLKNRYTFLTLNSTSH